MSDITAEQARELVARNDQLTAEMSGMIDRLRAQLEADAQRIVALEQLKVHCPDCGADYAQTGIEAGCPCKLRDQVRALEAERAEIAESFRQAEEGRQTNARLYERALADKREAESALSAAQQKLSDYKATGPYEAKALDLAVETLMTLKPEELSARAPKIACIIRNGAEWLRAEVSRRQAVEQENERLKVELERTRMAYRTR